MNLLRLRHDLSGARRATACLLGLLVVSVAANLVLAGTTAVLARRERVVLVPPAIHKTFWVETEQASPEYLEQMGYFLVQLVLNATPQSVDHQAKLLLQYAAPAAAGELRAALAAAAERLKRDGAATVFAAQELSADAGRMALAVRGRLTTYVGERRVAETQKAYALTFEFSAGRLRLSSFRETPAHDPFETRPAAPAAGA